MYPLWRMQENLSGKGNSIESYAGMTRGYYQSARGSFVQNLFYKFAKKCLQK